MFPPRKFGMTTFRSVKLTPPRRMPTAGMTMSLTRELTIAENAVPITIPTAKSMTLPWLIKVLNSWTNPLSLDLLMIVLLYYSAAKLSNWS